MTRVLVAGISTRAAADSAARAGFAVTSLDGYADRDQHPGVRAIALPRFTAVAAARAARAIDGDAVAYLSNFENAPRAVALLAQDRTLLGNPPEVLHRVRDPFAVAAALREAALPGPAVVAEPPGGGDWLLKPVRSGGGHGVRDWRGGRVPRGSYLQERIDGIPGSITFVAAEGDVLPLGTTRQLIGDVAFGARGYRYCGSILRPAIDSDAVALARVLARTFDLVGVNGIDFVERDGAPWPIEINPRWSSSMELVERATGTSVFALHADACGLRRNEPDRSRLADLTRSVLQTTAALDPASALHHGKAFLGKAIVFARHNVTIGDTDSWLEDPDIRDVPHQGDRISSGSPVCTVFATGASEATCLDALVQRADAIYRRLSGW